MCLAPRKLQLPLVPLLTASSSPSITDLHRRVWNASPQAGLQDRVIQTYEGCMYMDFSKDIMESQVCCAMPSQSPPTSGSFTSERSLV